MDFRNANSLNSRVNLLSGNMLPVAAGDPSFSLGWRFYNLVVWLIEVVHTIGLIFGICLAPLEKALNDGTVCCVITIEAAFMLTRFYTRRKLLARIVGQLDDILREADETMKDIVNSSLHPVIKTFTVYGVISGITVILWTVQPVTLAFNRDIFFYVDYNLPTAFSGEPFSRGLFVGSTVLMTTGSFLLFLKKYGVDVYMMHMVLVLTAQYQHTAKKLSLLFRDSQRDSCDDELCGKTLSHLWRDREEQTGKELRALCQRHNKILRISFMLRELLAVNFSLLFVNSVFRFCFIGVLMSTIPSLTLTEGISILLFVFGSITQFFLLCSSVQTLSDASTEITDTAFDENWYQYGFSIKRTFLLLMMANKLECKIAAIDKFNLSLPSFMTIMNQSYSIALLFLRTKQ